MNTRIVYLALLCLIMNLQANAQWSLSGNGSTDPATNFIGTTDNKDIVLRTNSIEKLRIQSEGSFLFNSRLYDIVAAFTSENWYSAWVVINSQSANPSTGSGFRMYINNAVKSQLFFNANAFSFGTTLDGLVGNTDIVSRTGDAYLSTGYFKSNGLVVKNTTGFVGIGNYSPSEKLDVAGNIRFSGALMPGNSAGSTGQVLTSAGPGNAPVWANAGSGGAGWGLSGNAGTSGAVNFIGTTDNTALRIRSNNTERMVITANGNIGIGTATPDNNAQLQVNGNIFSNGKIAIGTTDMAKMAGYSLVVNGEALFTKVRVKLYNNWPDFIFSKDHQLMPLEDLEQYITVNKHLPGIQAAEEVKKNGIDVGANQALLLQKIEELTLYVLEQHKEIGRLKKIIAGLRR